WRIDVERLRFEIGKRGARSWIAAMSDARIAEQVAHVARAEHVADVAGRLIYVKHRPLRRGDTGRILPAVLHQQQPFIQQLVDRGVRDSADDSAHLGAYLYLHWCRRAPRAVTRIIEPLGPLRRQPGLQ